MCDPRVTAAVQKDWKNREVVELVHLNMLKITSFLNEFELSMRYKFAKLNERITLIERNLEFCEGAFHCGIEQTSAISTADEILPPIATFIPKEIVPPPPPKDLDSPLYSEPAPPFDIERNSTSKIFGSPVADRAKMTNGRPPPPSFRPAPPNPF